MDASIALDDGRLAAIEQAVADGEAPSVQAAVELALDAWLAQRALLQIPDSDLRRLWSEGRASGAPEALDLASLKADVLRSLAKP